MTKARRKRIVSDNGHSRMKDAELVITVDGGPLDGQEIRMDPMLVRLTADELVQKHKLPEVDGELQATASFAKELCDRLVQLEYGCTPSVAIHAWIKVSEYFAKLQKKTS